MRSEADTLGGMRFSRWPRSVVMWAALTTVVTTAWGSSRYFHDVVDARVDRDRVNDQDREVGEATAIQFCIDALQSSQASLAETDLERARSFIARLQPKRTLSEPEREGSNRSLTLTAVSRGDEQPFRPAQLDWAAGQ